MEDPETRRKLIGEKHEALRAHAARERLVRHTIVRRQVRRPVRVALGLALVRIGRVLSGEAAVDEASMASE